MTKKFGRISAVAACGIVRGHSDDFPSFSDKVVASAA